MQVHSVHGGVAGNQSPQACQPLAAPFAEIAAQSTSESGRRNFLNLIGVAKKFGVSERTAARIVTQDWFPKPMQLVTGTSRGVRRWVEQEIDAAAAANAPREEMKPEPEHLKRARQERVGRGLSTRKTAAV